MPCFDERGGRSNQAEKHLWMELSWRCDASESVAGPGNWCCACPENVARRFTKDVTLEDIVGPRFSHYIAAGMTHLIVDGCEVLEGNPQSRWTVQFNSRISENILGRFCSARHVSSFRVCYEANKIETEFDRPLSHFEALEELRAILDPVELRERWSMWPSA